jgi:hypothetical protein
MKAKIAAVTAIVAVLAAGCSASGESHAKVAPTGTGTAPAKAGRAVVAACAKFRSATIVMLEFGPTDSVRLKRFGREAQRLGEEIAGQSPGTGRALTQVGAHALAMAAGHTPQGLIAAYNTVKRGAANVAATCPGASP